MPKTIDEIYKRFSNPNFKLTEEEKNSAEIAEYTTEELKKKKRGRKSKKI
jgi:hypothetical protein